MIALGPWCFSSPGGIPASGAPPGRPGRCRADQRPHARSGPHPGLRRQSDRPAQPALLQGTAGQALDDAHRHEKLVAAFFIDLDHFSRINDTLGHEAGDQLLQQVAVRLRASCRGRDDQVSPAVEMIAPEVARLGGDEFTVIMPGLVDAEDAAKLARRILSSLAHPIQVAEQEVFVNASIGIAIYPFDGEDLETLLMHADTAMYKAKEQGGSCYQTFSRSMNATALHRLTLESDLRRALSARSSSCTTSRSWTPAPAPSPARRRWSAGAIRISGCCCPRSSSRSPKKTA